MKGDLKMVLAHETGCCLEGKRRKIWCVWTWLVKKICPRCNIVTTPGYQMKKSQGLKLKAYEAIALVREGIWQALQEVGFHYLVD